MAHGLCATHYWRLRKTGSLDQPIRTGPAEPRFWAKVDQHGPDECWPWIPRLMETGYGRVWWNGKSESAHRIAYLLGKGPIPDGLHVDHLCGNRACQNPAHLEAVMSGENNKRMHQAASAETRARRQAAGRRNAAIRWNRSPIG